MDAARIQSLLPWRHPFLMIDRVAEWRAHDRIVTLKQVTAGDPLVPEGGSGLPALSLLEGMSQSAALLHVLTYDPERNGSVPLLGFLKTSLAGSAAVGQTVRFEVRSLKMTRTAGVFAAAARVETGLVAEAELAFSVADGREVRR